MNWKEKLADWLTGGAYSSAADEIDYLNAQDVHMCNRITVMRDALRDIAAMKTPSANATVKRMAARAKDVLG